jgi:hypothetical protein
MKKLFELNDTERASYIQSKMESAANLIQDARASKGKDACESLLLTSIAISLNTLCEILSSGAMVSSGEIYINDDYPVRISGDINIKDE